MLSGFSPEGGEDLVGIAGFCFHLPGFDQKPTIERAHRDVARFQLGLERFIPVSGLRLIAPVPHDVRRPGFLNEGVQALPRGSPSQDQCVASGLDGVAKCGQRMMQPPARRPAHFPAPRRFVIKDINRHDGATAFDGAHQCRIVGEPQILAKPDNDGRCGGRDCCGQKCGNLLFFSSLITYERQERIRSLASEGPKFALKQEIAPVSALNSVISIARKGQAPLEIGNDRKLTFIAGPCAMESRQHALDVAGELKEIADRLDVGLIYKTSYDKANRTSLSSERGLGMNEAMPIFAEVRETTGLPVLTDVHTAEQCGPVGEVVDVIQIPAFLCRQTDLLVAAAKTGCVINVKKGQFLAPWDMKNVVAKLTGAGNPNIMACERGASFGYNTLVSDMRSLPILASIGCPVVFDATHSVQQPGGQGATSGGQREFVPTLATAAVAIGVAAVFMETHPDPDNAPSDGPNMVPLSQFEALCSRLLEFDALAKGY